MGKKLSGTEWQDDLVVLSQMRRQGFGAHEQEWAVGRERWAIRLLFAGFLSLVGIIVARLVYLQIFESGQHFLMAASNHLETLRKEAPRGIIYDRHGEPLVRNVEDGHGGYTREYLLGPAGGSLLGYISEVRSEELGCTDGICREPGTGIGRTGIEKTFDTTLRGKDGGRLVELNATGQEVRELGINNPEPGTDLHLSIDIKLQQILYESLHDRIGSAVAVDMQGKVLGIVSSPSYDPNLFTVSPNQSQLATMLTDESKQYFLNRAIAGLYPPGSVFKPVTAYAGLEKGVIDKETLIEDTGEIRIDQYRYGNWYFDQYGRTEGDITVIRALARSNDIFFYKVGELVGIDTLVRFARLFGYGSVTGIELPGEKEGLVPDRLWKERATGEKWFLGNTYHMSIGQGDLQVTPIQVARMTAGVVSGRLCRLSLLTETKVECENLGLSEESVATVREGMKEVCQTGGTAFPFFDFDPWVLCKTGTAQHAGQKTESDKPHAWIVVAYPGENPEMILTVMLDSAGEGSYEAGPVAKEILERWKEIGK